MSHHAISCDVTMCRLLYLCNITHVTRCHDTSCRVLPCENGFVYSDMNPLHGDMSAHSPTSFPNLHPGIERHTQAVRDINIHERCKNPVSCKLLRHQSRQQSTTCVAERRHRKQPANLGVHTVAGHDGNRSNRTSEHDKKTLTDGRCTALSCEFASDHTTTCT